MKKSLTVLEQVSPGTPPATKPALTIPAIRHVKHRTWYYGVRCACDHLLVLCEDLFAGKGDELTLEVRSPITAECDCGAVITASVLHKFKTP